MLFLQKHEAGINNIFFNKPFKRPVSPTLLHALPGDSSSASKRAHSESEQSIEITSFSLERFSMPKPLPKMKPITYRDFDIGHAAGATLSDLQKKQFIETP